MPEKKPLRKTQFLALDRDGEDGNYAVGFWKDKKFHQLRKGDVFRLYDSDKDGVEKPDVVTDEGHHQICVALSDAQPTDGEVENYVVQSMALNGL